MSEKDDFGTFFAGLVVGGLVGAAVALLLAPQSGEETRTLIRDRSIELKDRAVEYGQDAKMRAEKAMVDARSKAVTAIEDLRVRTDEEKKALNKCNCPDGCDCKKSCCKEGTCAELAK